MCIRPWTSHRRQRLITRAHTHTGLTHATHLHLNLIPPTAADNAHKHAQTLHTQPTSISTSYHRQRLITHTNTHRSYTRNPPLSHPWDCVSLNTQPPAYREQQNIYCSRLTFVFIPSAHSSFINNKDALKLFGRNSVSNENYIGSIRNNSIKIIKTVSWNL